MDNRALLPEVPERDEAKLRSERSLFFMVTCFAFATNMCFASMSSFFTGWALDNLGVGDAVVAVIFSATSAAQLATGVVQGALARQKATLDVVLQIQMGLFFAGSGALCFGVSTRVWEFIVARSLIGVGTSLGGTARVSLIVHYASDIALYTGYMEAGAAAGLLLGPIIGGSAYELLGFSASFFITGAPVLLLPFATPGLVRAITRGDETAAVTTGEESTTLGADTSSAETGQPKAAAVLRKEEEEDGGGSGSAVLGGGGGDSDSGTVVVGGNDRKGGGNGSSSSGGGGRVMRFASWSVWGGLIAAFSALAVVGFLDMALALHLELTLGLGASAAGGMLALPAVFYAVTSPISSKLARREGKRRMVLMGCGLIAASLLLLGPTPLAYASGLGRGVAWAAIVLSLVVLGVSMGMTINQSMPLMIAGQFDRAGSECASSGGGGDEKVSKAMGLELSAALVNTFAVGKLLGPLIGGGLLEVMPQVQEVGCASTSPTGEDCLSAFPWVATVLAAWALALLAGCIELLPHDRPCS